MTSLMTSLGVLREKLDALDIMVCRASYPTAFLGRELVVMLSDLPYECRE